MSDLNQMYVSYLIDQKLRQHEIPASDHVTRSFDILRSGEVSPSLISRIIGSLRHRSSRRRHDVAVPTLTRAKGTGGIS